MLDEEAYDDTSLIWQTHRGVLAIEHPSIGAAVDA